MKHGPFEDVFPIENGDIPACYVSLPEGRWRFLFKSFNATQNHQEIARLIRELLRDNDG